MLVSAYQQKVTPTPPMGWSTWCTESGFPPCYDDFCSESEILNIAQSMKTNGMLDLGYNYIMLDDCWAAKNRSSKGHILEDLTRFPNGMKNFTASLHALGFKLSLYTDVGETTCRGGRLGSWPFYESDAKTFALDWEIDAVKMDWCHHPAGFTQQELYTNFSNALQATGRDMYFSICGWGLNKPWLWAPKISNAWRAGPDHIPLWYLKNGTQVGLVFPSYVWVFFVHDCSEGSWTFGWNQQCDSANGRNRRIHFAVPLQRSRLYRDSDH